MLEYPEEALKRLAVAKIKGSTERIGGDFGGKVSGAKNLSVPLWQMHSRVGWIYNFAFRREPSGAMRLAAIRLSKCLGSKVKIF
jgi:hypothetical protein